MDKEALLKDYQERKKRFQEGLARLIKECDIEPIPSMFYGNVGAMPQITLLDLRNPVMLREFGRTLIKKADAPVEERPTEKKEEPQNPLAN